MNKKEERAKLLAEMKEMNEKAANEKRSFSEDEKKVFAEKEERFRVLSAEIETEEREQKLNGFTDTLPKGGEDKPKTSERKGFFRTISTYLTFLDFEYSTYQKLTFVPSMKRA